jgi:hypothetical protein
VSEGEREEGRETEEERKEEKRGEELAIRGQPTEYLTLLRNENIFRSYGIRKSWLVDRDCGFRLGMFQSPSSIGTAKAKITYYRYIGTYLNTLLLYSCTR